MRPTIEVKRQSNLKTLQERLKKVGSRAVYVGIPSSTAADRSVQLLAMAEKTSGKKQAKLIEASKGDVSNAELLFIFSKGSVLRGQPPRPVLEPSIEAEGNKEAISYELAQAQKATLDGNSAEVTKRLKRAGVAGQNAARAWFTDPRNSWAPNKASTIAAKGSETPGIDTGAMKAALVWVIED